MNMLEKTIKEYVDFLTEKGIEHTQKGNTIISPDRADIEFTEADGEIYYTIGLSKNLWLKWDGKE